MRLVKLQGQDFDTAALLAALEEAGTGGVSSFTGLVRQNAAGDLAALRLEHYPGMTEKALERLADEALARWPLTGCVLIHRVGRLRLGQAIVLVATASAHRAASLAATAYLIDQLKTRAPFWKAEERTTGETDWIQHRQSDDQATAAWHHTPHNLPHDADKP